MVIKRHDKEMEVSIYMIYTKLKEELVIRHSMTKGAVPCCDKF